VTSRWFTAAAEVPTLHPAELVATKIRALDQRKIGTRPVRPMAGPHRLDLDPWEIVEAFARYRPADLTRAVLQRNLRATQHDAEFRSDLDLLIADVPSGCTVDAAAELVIAEIAPLL